MSYLRHSFKMFLLIFLSSYENKRATVIELQNENKQNAMGCSQLRNGKYLM